MAPRLIEKRLPLAEVSEQSAKEKSIRHGHISTLHIWWARRPLAASRAAVFGTLVPDSDGNYELVEKIVPWEAVKDGNSDDILEARKRVLEANGGTPPKVLDPFAGGGAIPLEALRLGCETYALDLNPVAHIIQRATLEYPQRYGQPTSGPVPEYIREKDAPKGKNHQASAFAEDGEWASAYQQNPLAAEVRYWGEWVLERARGELAEFYPADEDGKTPVAYLWARTVTCTNPACRAEVPLVRQWWLAKKSNKRIALKPVVDKAARTVEFEVVEGVGDKEKWPDEGTITRGNASCLVCGTTIPVENVRESARDASWGERMLAVVLSHAEESGKSYRAAQAKDLETLEQAKEHLEQLQQEMTFDGMPIVPNEPMQGWRREIRPPIYGIKTWGEIFNPRQALALVTFAKRAREAHKAMLEHGMDEERARAVATYLGITLDKLADYNSSICRWANHGEYIGNTFTRQALPMVWDFAETVPVVDTSGCWSSMLDWNTRAIENAALSAKCSATVLRGSATRIPLEDNFLDAIVTDPPYYDAISYAELSDFFYVWLKRSIGHLYPAEFRTPLTPKAQEAVQNPSRHNDDNNRARQFFEDMMTSAFKELHRVLKPRGEATIMFAHKSTAAWATLIASLISAGFRVEASWPVHTEMKTKMGAQEGRTMLASSVLLNCTKRISGEVGYFNTVRQEMQAAIKPQLDYFWRSGIRGADFFMSAIGPGLESYSRYDEVRRASGEPVTVGEFLIEVQKIVLDFALSHVMKEAAAQQAMDAESEFALLSLWAYGYELPSDEARKLAQSMNVELGHLSDIGLVKVSGEKAKLLDARERLKAREKLGLPQNGQPVYLVDALHKTLTLLASGRQAISDYLGAVGYLDAEGFWRSAQAFAEVLGDDEAEGRALDELLTLRDNLPKPSQAAQAGLFS